MAKNQPKLTDMTELLLQQVIQLEHTIKQSKKTHLDTIKELSNIKVTVNVAELRQIEKEQRQRLQNDFDQFHREITKNNEELLKVHKAVSSKRLFYLIVLNIFLLLTTGFSMYLAVKNTIEKSEYERLEKEKGQLINQLENVNQFFNKNPRTAKSFKEWSQKQ
ncbi:hypothetical protein HX045_15825 [Myroides odoratimimus]|uniref:Uncharacterized protein n=2 Tax=Flavobacteriaceae TaxID=49546 RepID=A0A3P3VXP5_9FLAO|nr:MULTISPECIES: hypothetical protein [Bacteroidota]EHO11452.1 hypothetical protein HMPREF9714_01346 [Myroides odoratimimus CCUG 12901]MBB1151459.1 hypothetical protein [Myroides sp. NP-2]MCA4808096.1 hypothetical protein [Myroides odoratimimus]MCC9041213.1 hypothetical protein [Myroides oncorhynchi]MCS7474312.1 hypothetical protein [Myroides odoratimimus]